MANSILLHKVQKSLFNNNFDSPSFKNESKLLTDIVYNKPKEMGFYKNSPFVRLTEYPVFLHHEISDDFVLESKSVTLNTVKLGPTTIESFINNNVNKKYIIYFKGKGNEIEIQSGPTIYNVENFMPMKSELFRTAIVQITDKQIENLIFEHRYYSELVQSNNKLFYFENKIYMDCVEKELKEINNNLNNEEYSIYCELVKRLGIPEDYDTLSRWLTRIKDGHSNPTEEKNYKYTIVRRNGKYTR